MVLVVRDMVIRQVKLLLRGESIKGAKVNLKNLMRVNEQVYNLLGLALVELLLRRFRVIKP